MSSDEYFIGANVYQRIHWLLDNIDKQERTIEAAIREIHRLRRQTIEIAQTHEISEWLAEECYRRTKKQMKKKGL